MSIGFVTRSRSLIASAMGLACNYACLLLQSLPRQHLDDVAAHIPLLDFIRPIASNPVLSFILNGAFACTISTCSGNSHSVIRRAELETTQAPGCLTDI